MAEDKDEAKRRTEVKDLPRPEKELSADEQKEVQGGMHHIISDGWSSQKPEGGRDQTEANRGQDVNVTDQAGLT